MMQMILYSKISVPVETAKISDLGEERFIPNSEIFFRPNAGYYGVKSGQSRSPKVTRGHSRSNYYQETLIIQLFQMI